MDLYSASNLATVGNPDIVKIFSSSNAAPGSLLYKLSELTSLVDSDGTFSGSDGIWSGNVRSHVDFATPITLAAGTYFFGMSGDGIELGQTIATGLPPGQGMLFILDGDTVNYGRDPYNTYDAAFRLEGDAVSAVPLPAALPLFGSGVLALAGVAWRRRGKVS